jgi:hypothetical protein
MKLLATTVAVAAGALFAAAPTSAQTKIKIADSFPVGHYLPKYFTMPMVERLNADPAAKGYEF